MRSESMTARVQAFAAMHRASAGRATAAAIASTLIVAIIVGGVIVVVNSFGQGCLQVANNAITSTQKGSSGSQNACGSGALKSDSLKNA